MKSHKTVLLTRRRKRVRKKITGTPDCPRLSVRRSLNHIYAQLIDDVSGKTITEASSVTLRIPGGNVESARKVGEQLAGNASEKSISRVAFDRNGRLYHGRIKALAEAARKSGLQF